MKRVNVSLGLRSYDVVVASGNLSGVAGEMKNLALDGKVLIVTNATVGPLYCDAVAAALADSGYSVHTVILPDGENYKNLDTAGRIYEAALEAGLDRNGIILALGGGVIGDMAGFAAATYMRGINFVQVPTTLLAQVDASVGGKVAVNHPRGKNLIGTFYQPKLVWADVDTLSTLPQREKLSGLAEVIKYGIIADSDFFTFLEQNVLSCDKLDFLIDIVVKSCSIKAHVVSKDEHEKDIRAILNFGHTIGHGLEAATHYQEFRHGEAVAIGMVGAAMIALEMGLTTSDLVQRIRNLLSSVGLPTVFSHVPWEQIWYHIKADKKAKDGNINFILPTSPGSVMISEVREPIIKKVVESELRE